MMMTVWTLANIRSKRAAAKEREEAEAAAEERVQMEKAALTGNPLLIVEGCASSGMIERRWNDDVVFPNRQRRNRIRIRRDLSMIQR